jgi:serine O-acetyltransferase
MSQPGWDPKEILELAIKKTRNFKDNWEEKCLQQLIEKIIGSYEKHGGIEHLEGKDLPSKDNVIEILENLISIVFPGFLSKTEVTKSNSRYFIGNSLHFCYIQLTEEIEKSLKYFCRRFENCPEDVFQTRAKMVTQELLEMIPKIRALLRGDIQAAYKGDPAAKSIDEVILSYPCVLAIATYRIAHELHMKRIPFVPRIMCENAHSKTGIDIHPGATIGKNFFIDHGTGVVIGETAEIGDDVKIYQGVTLGALSFPKDNRGKIIRGTKRHPTIGNNVVIYSGATLLGDETVVGDNAVIGGNVWITSYIPSGTKVTIVPPEHSFKDLKATK